jgi:Flp pilus assembly protein TadD
MATAFLTCALLLTGTDAAQAASKRDHRICKGGGLFDFDKVTDGERAASCTRIIEDRRESAKARAEAYFQRSTTYGSDRERQLSDLDAAIELSPREYGYYSARALANTGIDHDRAIADWSEAIRLSARGSLDRESAYNGRGFAFFEKGDSDRAIADLSEAIRLGGHNAYFASRGDAYARKGDYDRAIADYDEAIRRLRKSSQSDDFDFAEYYNRRGRAFRNSGDHGRAIADHTRAADLDPKLWESLYDRGVARYFKGDFKGAGEDVQRSMDKVVAAGGGFDAHQVLFRYLARVRAGEKAAEELEAGARQLDVKTWPHAVVELYLGRRAPAATLDAARGAVERCQAHFFVGVWHAFQGEPAEAERALAVARDTCRKDTLEFGAAVVELARLKTLVKPAPARPAGIANKAVELEFWQSVKDSGNAAMLQAYLDKFPDGTFAALARIKLEQLSGKPPEDSAKGK